jgi:hypothetical protein
MLEFESYYGHKIRGHLNQNNLPTQRINTSITLAKLIAPIVMVGSAAAILLFNLDLLFGMTFLIGLGIFVTRALVRKSVEATQLTIKEDSILRGLKELEQKILQAKYLTKHSSFGEKAYNQTKELTEHYSKIINVINQKFNPSELAYARYESALMETTVSLSDNLKMINSTIHSMEISSQPDQAQADLVKLITQNNDESIKLLGNLLHSLNQINAGGSMDTSLENSLDELKRLTEQTKKYSR